LEQRLSYLTMLQNLNIIDLAVVKSLDLDLQKGMSVLTGETGAGKSILLTALGLALGDRADSSYIRPGSKRAEINLEFDLSDSLSAQQWLQENELDNGNVCLIRRVISQDGRSKAFINNRPVTLQSLQTLSEKLVEIHGQHAHLTLLHQNEQRNFLDNTLNAPELVAQVATIFQQWHSVQQQLETLMQAATDQAAREDMLRYQIDELAQLDLNNFNYQDLSDEHNRLANLGQILTTGQSQLDLLYDNEQQSVYQMLSHSIHELTQLTQLTPEVEAINNLLNEGQIQIEEAALELRRFLESQEADPQRMVWLENQIGIIHNLSRKHQIAPEKLPELAENLATELDALTHSNEKIEALKTTVTQLKNEYNLLADKLSKQRQLFAKKMQEIITATIQELGMPQGDFQISVSQTPERIPKPYGYDHIEFLVSANPGLPPRPLGKVASGGELSRISLAIQVATSNDKTIATMIFDEVDSGIGGGIAEIVGQKLRHLSKDRQVLCVTHLPQVAAQAHHHLFVAKSSTAEITTSNVKQLTAQERTVEVARMLGGVKITDQTLAHAQEMLNLAATN
jgi:DNA repair protein RecN (Recombination protein N)